MTRQKLFHNSPPKETIEKQSNVAYISHIIGCLIGIPFAAAWSKNFTKNLLITLGLFLIYLAIIILLIPLLPQTPA